MKISLSTKTLGFIFVISFILFSAYTTFHIITLRNNLRSAFVEKAITTSYAIESSILSRADFQNKEKLLNLIYKNLWLNPDIKCISFNKPQGDNLITYISNDPTKIDTYTDSDNLNSYHNDVTIYKIINSRNGKVLKLVTPVHISGQVIGTQEIDFTLENFDKKLNSIYILSIILYLSLTCLFIGVLYVFFKVVVIIPILKINEGIKSVTKNNLNFRVRIKSRDELGELARTFNQMISYLKEYKTQVERYSKTLEAQVKRRTKQLNKKVEELTKTKLALLNIMEDLNETNKKLKKAQSELRKSFRELKKLDIEKDRFISIAAHELKTPLTTLHGFSQLLQNEKILKDPEKRKKYLKIIEEETIRLSRLVTNVLELSRFDLGTLKLKIEDVKIPEILNDIKNQMEEDIKEKGLKLIIKTESKLPKIRTDKEKLREILINLISNSVKFTERGEITVECKKIDNNTVQFSVTDTGIGIPKSSYNKIFTRFFQVESPYVRKTKGSGLGLSICKALVETLGGKIWFKSKLGKGTTFFFTLPINFKSKK